MILDDGAHASATAPVIPRSGAKRDPGLDRNRIPRCARDDLGVRFPPAYAHALLAAPPPLPLAAPITGAVLAGTVQLVAEGKDRTDASERRRLGRGSPAATTGTPAPQGGPEMKSPPSASSPASSSSRRTRPSSFPTSTRSTTTSSRSPEATGSTSASTGAARRSRRSSRSRAWSASTATSIRRWSASSWSWTPTSSAVTGPRRRLPIRRPPAGLLRREGLARGRRRESQPVTVRAGAETPLGGLPRRVGVQGRSRTRTSTARTTSPRTRRGDR